MPLATSNRQGNVRVVVSPHNHNNHNNGNPSVRLMQGILQQDTNMMAFEHDNLPIGMMLISNDGLDSAGVVSGSVSYPS